MSTTSIPVFWLQQPRIATRPLAEIFSYLPINIRTYGAQCDGVSDDSAAIQAALNVAGSATNPPLGPNTESALTLAGSVPQNTGQGTVEFPHGVTVRIATALSLPPGVTLDLCGSTLLQTSAGQCAVIATFDLAQSNFYGAAKSCVKNGVIQGPGWNVSTTYGVFADGVDMRFAAVSRPPTISSATSRWPLNPT
jgi:hypothetical protein